MHQGIEPGDGLSGALYLELPHRVDRMNHLALQVGHIDPVKINDTDSADTGGGKIQ